MPQAYLSYKSLNLTPDIWASLDAAKKQEVVEARVWEPANRAQFLKDVRRGCAPAASLPILRGILLEEQQRQVGKGSCPYVTPQEEGSWSSWCR